MQEHSTYISEVQCSSACGGEAGGGGHLALADRPAFHTDINATWDAHFSSHCVKREREEESAVRHHWEVAHDVWWYTGWVWPNGSLWMIPRGTWVQGDIVNFQLETDSHLEHQVRWHLRPITTSIKHQTAEVKRADWAGGTDSYKSIQSFLHLAC